MSRMATNEYIGAKRRAYAEADRAKRRRLLDEVCETTGYSRKYANRLLTGSRKFRERRGRGRTYEVKAATPCASGEAVMACRVPPGDVQVDTFALGGGDPSESFFRILDGTDRKTQWTVLCPTWNRGRHATLEALRHIEVRFPFGILAVHSDNGGEILNSHVAAYLGGRAERPFLWRSRPRHSNDNAHVEEKNRSSGRQLFGEVRLDCPSLRGELVKLCDDWSDFRNLFCPCRMLVSKERRPDGKGCRCRYDRPRTPYQRVLDEHVPAPGQEAALKAYRDGLSGMELYRRVLRRLRKARRIQAAYDRARRAGEDLSPFAARPALALRATPPGPAGLRREGTCRTAGNRPMSHAEERRLSVQYLANQKPPSYLQSVLSI